MCRWIRAARLTKHGENGRVLGDGAAAAVIARIIPSDTTISSVHHEHTDPPWEAQGLKMDCNNPKAGRDRELHVLFFFFFFQTRLLSYFSRSASNFRFNRTLPAVSPTNFRPRAIFQIPPEFAHEMNSARSFHLT